MLPEEPPYLSKYFIDRGPHPAGFADWTCDDNAERLRSLVGPPGCGKSSHLWMIARALREDERRRFIILFLDLTMVSDDHELAEWLFEEIHTLREAGYSELPEPPSANSDSGWAAFLQLLGRVFEALGPLRPVLLCDGYDKLLPQRRQWVEQYVLVPFLFPDDEPSVGRVVMVRRGEYGLSELILVSEEEVHWLERLDATPENRPLEQVEQRLAAVAQTPAEARALLEWPDAPDEAIAFATRPVAANDLSVQDPVWATSQTPTPYVNLLLLQRKLLHPDAPLDAADWHAVLDGYLQRANVENLDAHRLVALAADLGDLENFSLGEYQKPRGNPVPYPEIGRLLKESLVVAVPKTARFAFEPAVAQLLRRLLPPPAAPNPAL